MAYASYPQRKALGLRYSVDPALVLDQQRLEQEYAIMPERARLAESKRQFDINQKYQEDMVNRQGTSSAVGTVGNLASTYMMTKGGGLFSSAPSAAPALVPAASMGANSMAGAVAPASSFVMGGSTPALTNALATETGTGLGVGAMAPGGAVAPSAATGTGLGLTSLATPAMYGAGAGMVGGALGKSGTIFGKDTLGKALSFGGNDEKTNSALAGNVVGSGLGAIAGGASIGAAGMSWSGPGALVGAVVGGIVGAVSALVDSWICTACHRIVGMSKEEIEKMDNLKHYCEKEHKEWLESYIINAPSLVKAIAEQEEDLESFYMRIREILVDPIFKEEDIEKCFEIYLSVVKALFEKYMPEFEFKEVE